MQVDLLLTTQNRHAEMRRLLDSLCRQRTPAFRLVAGLQDADEAMCALLAAYADRIVTLIDGEIVSNQVNKKERT